MQLQSKYVHLNLIRSQNCLHHQQNVLYKYYVKTLKYTINLYIWYMLYPYNNNNGAKYFNFNAKLILMFTYSIIGTCFVIIISVQVQDFVRCVNCGSRDKLVDGIGLKYLLVCLVSHVVPFHRQVLQDRWVQLRLDHLLVLLGLKML
jgi:hypothetical protein